jgi:NADPH-dependent 7-cyano-7-deazaguanine reductase QueF
MQGLPLTLWKHKTKVSSKLKMRKNNSLDKDPKLPDFWDIQIEYIPPMHRFHPWFPVHGLEHYTSSFQHKISHKVIIGITTSASDCH